MRSIASVFFGLLAVLCLSATAQAQSGSSEKYDGGWQPVTAGETFSGGVGEASVGNDEYWVLGDGGALTYRVRKDDPSLSSGETDKLETAYNDGKRVQVEVTMNGSTPEVHSVTILPGTGDPQ